MSMTKLSYRQFHILQSDFFYSTAQYNGRFTTLSNKEFMKEQTYWTVVAVIDSWQVFGPLLLGTGSEDYVRRGYELKNK